MGSLRICRKDAMHILTEGEVTSNVVYPEALVFGEDPKVISHVLIRAHDQRITFTMFQTRTPLRVS